MKRNLLPLRCDLPQGTIHPTQRPAFAPLDPAKAAGMTLGDLYREVVRRVAVKHGEAVVASLAGLKGSRFALLARANKLGVVT